MNGAPLTGPGNLIKGRWKILKKIGQGAFGRVCLGWLAVADALCYRGGLLRPQRCDLRARCY